MEGGIVTCSTDCGIVCMCMRIGEILKVDILLRSEASKADKLSVDTLSVDTLSVDIGGGKESWSLENSTLSMTAAARWQRASAILSR